MNRRKLLTLLLSGVLILALFAGCGASSNEMAYDKGDISYESAVESPETGIYDTTSKGEEVKVSEQKLIKTVNISTETEDLDKLLLELDQQIASLGGLCGEQECAQRKLLLRLLSKSVGRIDHPYPGGKPGANGKPCPGQHQCDGV